MATNCLPCATLSLMCDLIWAKSFIQSRAQLKRLLWWWILVYSTGKMRPRFIHNTLSSIGVVYSCIPLIPKQVGLVWFSNPLGGRSILGMHGSSFWAWSSRNRVLAAIIHLLGFACLRPQDVILYSTDMTLNASLVGLHTWSLSPANLLGL